MRTVARDNRQSPCTAPAYLTAQAINMAAMRTNLAILQVLPGALHSYSQLMALIQTEVSCYSPHGSSEHSLLSLQPLAQPQGGKSSLHWLYYWHPFRTVFSPSPSNGCFYPWLCPEFSIRRSLVKPMSRKRHHSREVIKEGSAKSPKIARDRLGQPRPTRSP